MSCFFSQIIYEKRTHCYFKSVYYVYSCLSIPHPYVLKRDSKGKGEGLLYPLQLFFPTLYRSQLDILSHWIFFPTDLIFPRIGNFIYPWYVKVASGLVGQEQAREAAGLVVDLIRVNN